VLRVRRLQEEQARWRLMQANRAARDTAERVDAALHSYVTAERPIALMSHADFTRSQFRLRQAALAVEQARAAHREALDRVDAARVEWMEAKQRVAALERLESRRRDEHVIDMRRAEDRLIDDLVVARHRVRTGQGVAE
jgi:flagellar biosynthesis chaperone FliJ